MRVLGVMGSRGLRVKAGDGQVFEGAYDFQYGMGIDIAYPAGPILMVVGGDINGGSALKYQGTILGLLGINHFRLGLEVPLIVHKGRFCIGGGVNYSWWYVAGGTGSLGYQLYMLYSFPLMRNSFIAQLGYDTYQATTDYYTSTITSGGIVARAGYAFPL